MLSIFCLDGQTPYRLNLSPEWVAANWSGLNLMRSWMELTSSCSHKWDTIHLTVPRVFVPINFGVFASNVSVDEWSSSSAMEVSNI